MELTTGLSPSMVISLGISLDMSHVSLAPAAIDVDVARDAVAAVRELGSWVAGGSANGRQYTVSCSRTTSAAWRYCASAGTASASH